MPIPRPNEGEKKSDYIGRCVAFLTDEGKGDAEAVAICLSTWEDYDSETLSIKSGERLEITEERPANRFAKDAIREGRFINLNTKKPLDITRQRLQKWCTAFSKMVDNGINVPIADGHDVSKPLGHISAMRIVEDADGKARLWCDYDFADEDAVKTAKRSRFVSISTDPNYMDCEGNQYGEVIDHVAVTATPVISRQAEYVQLSRMDTQETGKEEMKMRELLYEIGGLLDLDIADDAEESAVKQLISSKIDTMKATLSEMTADKKEPAALSRELGEALAENAELRINGLVKAGRVTQAVAKELKLALVGKDADNVNALTLSRGESEKSIVNQVIDILEQNDPVELSAKTKAQILDDGTIVPKPEEKDEKEKFELARKEQEEKMKLAIK